MLVQLDPRQREEVVYQAPHALTFNLHNVEELAARGFIVARVAAQRIDEARYGCERRPQFVAGVGDEVCPRLFRALKRRHLLKRQDDELGRMLRSHDMRPVVPFDRHMKNEIDRQCFARCRRLPDCLKNRGRAQYRGDMFPFSIGADDRAHRLVGEHHTSAAIEQKQRIGQMLHHLAGRPSACTYHPAPRPSALRDLRTIAAAIIATTNPPSAQPAVRPSTATPIAPIATPAAADNKARPIGFVRSDARIQPCKKSFRWRYSPGIPASRARDVPSLSGAG